MKAIINFVLILISFNCFNAMKLPSSMKKCKLAEFKNSTCIVQRIEELKPRFAEGIPELKILPLDPLVASLLEFHVGPEGSNGVTATFTDLKISGLAKVDVKALSIDLENLELYFHMTIPHTRGEGNFQMHGKLPILELNAAGTGSLDFDNVDLKTSRKMKKISKNGKDYLKLQVHYKADFNYSKARVDFGNNQQFSEGLNKLFNENWSELRKDMDEPILRAVDELITGVAQNFFDEFPIDELYK